MQKPKLPDRFVAMARQSGDIKIVGSFDDLCFYKMDGHYYVRMKSCLTGKRFWKDRRFEGSRKSCTRFARGNQLASLVYRSIPRECRAYRMFTLLKREGIALLKQGWREEDVVERLTLSLFAMAGIVEEKKPKKIVAAPVPVNRHFPLPDLFIVPLTAVNSRKRRHRRMLVEDG